MHYTFVNFIFFIIVFFNKYPSGTTIYEVYANELMSQEFYGKKTLKCAGTEGEEGGKH